jgi:hypothetical protein
MGVPEHEQFELAERMVEILREPPDPPSWWVMETLRLMAEPDHPMHVAAQAALSRIEHGEQE